MVCLNFRVQRYGKKEDVYREASVWFYGTSWSCIEQSVPGQINPWHTRTKHYYSLSEQDLEKKLALSKDLQRVSADILEM